MYQRIEGENWRQVFIVGDLHGCLSEFSSQLRRQHFDYHQDLVISVGDLIDRGANSPGCLALLASNWFKAVKGNHEAMALAALDEGEGMLWQMNGGSWYHALSEPLQHSVRRALLQCRDLPLVIELRTHHKTLVIAHADYPAAHYRWNQPVDEHLLLWSRERLTQNLQGQGAVIDGADEFYFGHTPLKEASHFYNQYYIDTGAVFGNKLTMVQVQ
ncbi:serine/threonine-protein phosphatase [Buttiauxella warmboldiae]|uniref:Serine/threonine-protein phosphatase n=1 Tax=Buttiauxella warmboldiae TaxID=82993 RepID=A0A3N5D8B4_9ENTR|nr:metallophosphoesterase [Buttiauxella warmboldiae]RPH22890.1 serine/threonine-protein phosphatase [Buttiauxella warmboldiae]